MQIFGGFVTKLVKNNYPGIPDSSKRRNKRDRSRGKALPIYKSTSIKCVDY